MFNLKYKIYIPSLNETSVIIVSTEPFIRIERSLEGDWEGKSDEDIISEVLKSLLT
ncbi:hypothetical protein [Salinicoccus halitifaciens]|uniref:Uncharacterized protein n=1 Tax=Salinicoccus halitifaciens TaxID=1073415 RepID=A0ABV2E5T3_9STAP|nr:hypothetical protein [Salinicoccus halitifaciens]MCD2137163.1 hypothetical protein [Salinicoccus halitifaciens]